jgi:hypothetical protein
LNPCCSITLSTKETPYKGQTGTAATNNNNKAFYCQGSWGRLDEIQKYQQEPEWGKKMWGITIKENLATQTVVLKKAPNHY